MRLRVLLFVILTIISFEFFGQAISNSGFVFIDGKYIDAPYKIYTKDMAVYINGHQITKQLEWPVVNKSAFDHNPGIPAAATKYMSLDEALGLREPTKDVLYIVAVNWYLYTHYDYQTAFQKSVEYYESLPYVKSLIQSPDGYWILESYSGESVNIAINDPFLERLSAVWGPNGSGPPEKNEIISKLKNYEERYKNRLDKGDLFIISSPGNENSFSERKAAIILPEMIKILEGNLGETEKQNEIISIGLIQRGNIFESESFVKNCKLKPILKTRIKELVSKVESEYGPRNELIKDNDLKNIDYKKSILKDGNGQILKSGTGAYSPDGKYIYAGCAYTYDAAFDLAGETQPIIDDIKDQDYNSSMIVYKDDTNQDNLVGTMTYDNFKNMKYADFLYWTCHGVRSSGLLIIKLQTKAAVNTWSGNDSLNCIPVMSAGEIWPTGAPWYGLVKPDWATSNWNSILTQSKAIVILSCCYSHQNGWAGACGGGVTFGYDTSCTSQNNIDNDRELLQYMSGAKGNGQYRKAGQAYNQMSAYRDRFRIVPANAEITLAPAPESYDPVDGQLVPETGTGYFEVDTWCNDIIPADQALTFVTNGDVVISNVHWDGSGKVKKVLFDWEGEACWNVTVTVHHDKWQSWGAAASDFHKLDVNRVTPNTENGVYTFYSSDTLSLTMTKTNVSCYKGSDGTATVAVTNGTPPYTYSWSPTGGTGATASGLIAGTYKVRLTDANGCNGEGTVTITEPSKLNISIAYASSIPYCIQDGPPTVTLTASASGGTPPYTYSWPGGSLQINSSGRYSCTVTDSKGCVNTRSVLVRFIPILCSRDPNDIAGATGYEPGNWVSVKDVLPYTIRFENDPEFASAPAQKVVVTFPFDDSINPFSFKLGNFGFGSFNFAVPSNSIFYSKRLDCVDSLGVYVDVLAGIDITNNEAFWIFESIDPATGLAPLDALTGFLPVNDSITHIGEGFVSYTVQPKIISQTGDSIYATAEIVFDINESIFTNTWTNIIDAVPPVSVMDSFPAFTLIPQVDLTWQANDDPGGVGVGSYDLFMSKDGAPFALYMSDLDTNYYQFNGDVNSTYSFYVLAIDHTGNREPAKTTGEGTIQMGEPTIDVLTPEYLDYYCENDSVLITWDANGVTDFFISVSTDNGLSYDSITTLYDPPLREFMWHIIVNSPGDSCIIRITNPEETITGLSEKFVISGSPAIDLGPDMIIGLSEIMMIDAGAGYSSYTWNTGSISQIVEVNGTLGAGVYNLNVTVVNSYGCMGSDAIEINVHAIDTCIQNITLPNGWSLFSTYVYPHNPDISVVLSGIANNIIITKDDGGLVYWPFFGLNQIGKMKIGKGYQLKIIGVNQLIVEGECAVPENTLLSLPYGWSMLGYLRSTPAPIANMVSSLGTNLLFAKNGNGNVYWPMFSLDFIGNMNPGEGYQINMSVPSLYSYPANTINFTKAEVEIPGPLHFYLVPPTGSNMTVVIPLQAWNTTPPTGSEIGVFDSFGNLVGVSVFEGRNIAFPVWGDDKLTEKADGISEYENFTFKLWNIEDRNEYELIIPDWQSGGTEYINDSYSVAGKIETGEIIIYDKVMLYQNNPNPFKESTLIRFYLPEDMEVEISVYNVIGELVNDFRIKGLYLKGINEVEFNAANLSSGSYLCKLTTIKGVENQILNLVR